MRCLLRSLCSVNPASLTLGTICLVVALFFAGPPILHLVELKPYDLPFLSRGYIQPSSAVVMALIDEKSLATEGRWPWPRSKIATLIDVLSRDKARVIGLDMAFTEPDENSQLGLIQQFAQQIESLAIPHPQLTNFIQESQKLPDTDLTLAQAIQHASAAVVLGYFFHMSEADLNYRIAPQAIDQQLQRISASKYPFILRETPDASSKPFFTAYAPESNLEILTKAAAASGYFSL